MKKLFFAFILIFGSTMLNAQKDSAALQQYTGKYTFAEGSPVKEVGVIIENGILTATAPMGNSELKATENKDVFEVVAYAGTATFKRNADGKIIGVLIQVQDMNLEGTKVEEAVPAEKKMPERS